jgi:hypothetical protein
MAGSPLMEVSIRKISASLEVLASLAETDADLTSLLLLNFHMISLALRAD